MSTEKYNEFIGEIANMVKAETGIDPEKSQIKEHVSKIGDIFQIRKGSPIWIESCIGGPNKVRQN